LLIAYSLQLTAYSLQLAACSLKLAIDYLISYNKNGFIIINYEMLSFLPFDPEPGAGVCTCAASGV
jgi:hypothetical protein